MGHRAQSRSGDLAPSTSQSGNCKTSVSVDSWLSFGRFWLRLLRAGIYCTNYDPNVLRLQFSLGLSPQQARVSSAILETRAERSIGCPYAKRCGNRKLGCSAATVETQPRQAESAETSQARALRRNRRIPTLAG